jgi:hypothetical protein
MLASKNGLLSIPFFFYFIEIRRNSVNLFEMFGRTHQWNCLDITSSLMEDDILKFDLITCYLSVQVFYFFMFCILISCICLWICLFLLHYKICWHIVVIIMSLLYFWGVSYNVSPLLSHFIYLSFLYFWIVWIKVCLFCYLVTFFYIICFLFNWFLL